MLFDIEAPSLNEMILNTALALLFYVCGHEFLFQNYSIGNPQYDLEVWHQTPGLALLISIGCFVYDIEFELFLVLTF
jgi:hypothetical protein